MKKVIAYLETLYEDRITNDFDQILPVIGDEGLGKSTLMMQIAWLWLGITEREQTIDNVMDSIAWDLEDFQNMLANKPEQSVIIVHDAARVLSRKKAMHGEQIEVEEDLLDARFGNYLILLGYQEFDLVPTMLATRRAKNMFRIVKRGWVHGHNEAGISKRYKDERWPDPVFRDNYPDLEGTQLWEAFESEDQRRKRERIQTDTPDEEEEDGAKELARQFLESDEYDLQKVISIHGGHKKPYIDPDLVELELGCSGRKAKKVKKVLSRDVDPERVHAA